MTQPSRRSRIPENSALYLVWTVLGVMVGLPFIMTPLSATDQLWVAGAGFLAYAVIARSKSRPASVALIILSLLISSRYFYWRLTETTDFPGFWNGVLGTGLIMAELYAVVALLLSYIQTIWPLDRKPYPLPEDQTQWPTVDVFIPTYNEPLEVVKPSVYGALDMEYPRDRFRVILLDDGRRPEFQEFCEQIGCEYLTRPDNKGAKAGNINYALTQTNAEFIAIFDCDHVPTTGFLLATLGWLVKDPKLAMVQTPHHFYSPDPFERNLTPGETVPSEGLLFYGLIQPGNDLWNASFFCGSCAVIRRTALEEVGGVPHVTVTEDCHCSLKMQRLGWGTAYLQIPLAAGLATERLIGHIGQRMRWARGMVQIFRVDNPLMGKGLNLAQRLCYVASMWHFLFPIPRFVFLTSPLAFLLFGQSVVTALPMAILAYAAPHVVHAVITNSRLQSAYRHSFWSEIYETVLAIFLLPVIVLTLWDPKKGKFNVTQKGGVLEEGYFDFKAVWPNALLGLALLVGILIGLYYIMVLPASDLQVQAYILNIVWAVLSLVIVMAGLAVGRERQQVRTSARVDARLPGRLITLDGQRLPGHTKDVSLGGASFAVEGPDLPTGPIYLAIDLKHKSVVVPAEVLRWNQQTAQLQFHPQNLQDEASITAMALGRENNWEGWVDANPDRPLRALWDVVVSIGGVFRGDSQLRRLRGRQRSKKPLTPLQRGTGHTGDVI